MVQHIFLETTQNTKGVNNLETARNTNKIKMELQQDTATKPTTWLEPNDFGDK